MKTKVVTLMLLFSGTVFGLTAVYLWGKHVQQKSEEAFVQAYMHCARLTDTAFSSDVLGDETSQARPSVDGNRFSECLQEQLSQKK